MVLDQSIEEFGWLDELAQKVSQRTVALRCEVPYYAKLVEIRGVLEDATEFRFPYNCCQNASRVVQRVLGTQFRVEEVAGAYQPNENYSEWRHHAWNYDAERKLFIDLSLDQFFLGFPSVVVMDVSCASFVYRLQQYTRQQRLTESYLGVDRIVSVLLNGGRDEEGKYSQN